MIGLQEAGGLYNPTQPSGCETNCGKYQNPTDFSPYVWSHDGVSNQLTAYMLINSSTDLQAMQFNATTLDGTYVPGFTGYDRIAVSYDPVNHVAAATVDGIVVASVPYTAKPIGFAGVEGSLNANVNNFTVRAGAVTDPMPAAVAPPASTATTQF